MNNNVNQTNKELELYSISKEQYAHNLETKNKLAEIATILEDIQANLHRVTETVTTRN